MKIKIFKVLLWGCLAASAAYVHAGLKLADTNVVNLGKIYNYHKSEHEYRFVNDGPKDIRIVRLISTCTCIRGSNSVDVVKPGESCIVKTFFNARSVEGEFTRGVWVYTNDPDNNKTLLKVSGEILPLFTGIPEEPLEFCARDKNVVFTNSLTFAATTTNFFLGHPTSKQSNHVACIWSKVNSPTGTLWNLTTHIKPDAGSQQSICVKVPVEGPVPVSDIKLKFKLVIGSPLRASPSKLVVIDQDKKLNKTLYITTCSPEILLEQLKCSPALDGLKVTKAVQKRKATVMPSSFRVNLNKGSKSRHSSNIRYNCIVSIEPEALKKILAMKEAGITFSYPGHKPVFVPVQALASRVP